jgi:hypothetical protein
VSTGALGAERAPERSEHLPVFSFPGPVSSSNDSAVSQPKTTSSALVFSQAMRSVPEPNLPTTLLNVHPAGEVTFTDAITLSPVIVSASKLNLPDEEQIMSRDEFAALLRKRYPGASVPGQDPYQIANGMPNYARLQFESDRRIAQKASFEDFADLLERTGDHVGSEQLKKDIHGTFDRSNDDPLIDAMDKSANRGRR